MNTESALKRFNWRLTLARIIVNGLVLGATALLMGNGLTFKIGDLHPILALLIVGAIFGLLNAFVRPIIQFLTFPFLFVSSGLVLILINAIMLIILSWLTDLVIINNIFSAFIAGAIVGILSIVFESLFGLTPPILDDDTPDLLSGAPGGDA